MTRPSAILAALLLVVVGGIITEPKYDDHLDYVPREQWDRPMDFSPPGMVPYRRDRAKEAEQVKKRLAEARLRLKVLYYDDHHVDEIITTKAPMTTSTTTTTTAAPTTTTTTSTTTTTTTAAPTTTTTATTTTEARTTEAPIEIEEIPNMSGEMPPSQVITEAVDVRYETERVVTKVTVLPNAVVVVVRKDDVLSVVETPESHSVHIQGCHNLDIKPKVTAVFRLNNGSTHFYAACETMGNEKPWTIIQRRVDNTVFWNRTFAEYARGFGELTGSHWLGLDKVHGIIASTPEQKMLLRVELRHDVCNRTHACSGYGAEGYWWGEWEFAIGGPSTNYRLNLSTNLRGNLTAADDFFHQQNNGQPFTTVDVDNDARAAGNCAKYRSWGGWWHRDCGFTMLNGVYGENDGKSKGLSWMYVRKAESDSITHTYNINPAFTVMKIRPLY